MKRCVFIIFSLLLINILFISADVCTINPSCAYFKDGSISVGGGHTCGIRSNDSRVLCWGNSGNGILGNGQISPNRAEPYPIADTSAYLTVSAGYAYTCGIRATDSRVLCWGNGTFGQLGNGGTGNYLIPTLTIDSSPYKSISVGSYHTCGIRASDSRVLCWGDSEFGKLGDGQMYIDRTSPYLTTDTFAYLQVNAGWTHTCGIRASDSRVLCWGQGVDGRLGDGNLATHNVFSPNLTKDISAYGCSFICVACVPSCSCAVNTCTGQICSDGCSGNCSGTKICADCGNGIKESPEECDDNNLVNGDGCSNVCILQPEAYFLDFNGLRITEAHIGETVKLVLNNTGILNGSFEIFEDDPAFDDEIRTG